jgi:hypothetical protein
VAYDELVKGYEFEAGRYVVVSGEDLAAVRPKSTRIIELLVTDFIGQGGMGDVYKATDTRLDRTVAIKVLTQYVSSDPAGLTHRFEREAKTISSLNHPHICTLHDVERQDGIDFLVPGAYVLDQAWHRAAA